MSKVGGDNKDIKFPEEHYVNFQSRPSVDNVPLGFMTPHATDAAGKKRKESVDNWAQTYDRSTNSYRKTEGVIYKNEPMVGFKLSREIRRYASFGQGNVKWRIEDPRGFELEISSPNFAQIIMLCNLEKGEIMEQCIWGRLGAENILVPVDSDAYRAAQENTARVAKKVSLKDINIGDEVLMHNGEKGTFLGIFYFIRASRSAQEFGAKITDKKRYVFQVAKDRLSAIATPKISEATAGEKIGTQEESEKFINNFISNKNHHIHDNSNDYSKIVAVTSQKPQEGDIVITRHVATFEEARNNKLKFQGVVGFQMLSGEIRSFDFTSYAKAYAEHISPPQRHPAGHGFLTKQDSYWCYTYDSKKFENNELEPKTSQRYGYTSVDQNTFKIGGEPEEFVYFTFTAKTQYCGSYEMRMTRD